MQLGAEFVPELCEFAARQDVAILTYNSEGIVCERDQDVWANKECFTTKLPMIHVDDLASYVDYPICKMLITQMCIRDRCYRMSMYSPAMCGKFCAVRSMNKALAGEYIDIL